MCEKKWNNERKKITELKKMCWANTANEVLMRSREKKAPSYIPYLIAQKLCDHD